MALNSDTLLSYSQFLQCGACSCDITSPKLLSCLHSFCQTCLKDQDGFHVVTCPTCHQPTKKAEVKDNKLLSDLQSKLDILRQIARGSDLPCSCSNASARSMCFECEKFLCQKCFEGHQMFLAKENHSMESLESLKVMSSQEFLATARKKRVPYCPNHDKQTISIFCRTCSKSICTTCTVLMHKPPDHEYRDIKQEAQEQKDNLAKMCTMLCKKEDAFEEILEKLLNLKGDHQSRKRELEEQIKVSVKEAVRKVEQKGEALLKELAGIHKGMDAKMSKKLLHMEDVQKRIEGSKDLLENMIKYATDEEVMEMQTFVKSSLQQLQRSKPGNADALDFTVEFKKTDPEPLNLLGSLVVHKDMATGTNLEASTPIKIKRERQDDEEIKPGTYLAFELPPKHPYTPSLEKPGVSPVHPNFGQETADDSLLDYNDDECEETQSVVSGMMENKENIGDSLNSKESDKGTPLLECAGCLPSPAPAADQNIPVEDHSIVFFDLETTGLGSKCDIIQLSAACMEKTFNVYMVPRTPIMKGASAVTGFTVRRHKLYLHCRPVQTKTHRDCLMSFLAFLRALDRPLLAGHNIKRFDCPILARVLEEFQLNEEFKLLVSGFLDTLILSKDLLQNTGIKSFKQENLVKELLKKSYPAHNALEDVKALQDLYSALRPTPAQITSHLFTLDHMESHMSLQPLVEGKAISKTTAQKLARLGFNFEKMKRSHLQNPSEGLRQFLEPLKEELNNSMFTKTVDKICDFFKIEQ